MKTLKDLEEMKQKRCVPFENQYVFFFEMLESYYISKIDGLERIKAELNDWNQEAKEFICTTLIKNLTRSGIVEFDESEIWTLVHK